METFRNSNRGNGQPKLNPERVGPFAAWWVETVRRGALPVVALSILVTAATLYYTAKNFSIDTNTDHMLSERLAFRRIYEDYRKAFPQELSTILLVIDGVTPDLAQDAAKKLGARLERETRLFKSVSVPGGERFFEEHALLYLSLPELDELDDNLARVQPFLGKLARNPDLYGLFSMLGMAVDAIKQGEAVTLAPVFEQLTRAIDAFRQGRFYPISWQELMLGRPSTPEDRRQFVIVEPRLDFSRFQPAGAAMNGIRQLARELHMDEAHGIRLRITGDIALDHDELQTVSRGAEVATAIAFIMVVILLFIAYRSLWLVFSTLITLLFGLVWTAGFAIFAVGHLNLFSVTFAALYIGMAVDFSIHYCLRYRELAQQGLDQPAALSGAARGIGGSLVSGALVLLIGFYAFLPTAFVGVAELGLITGTGMLIGLFASITVLPALLTLRPLASRGISKKSPQGAGVLFSHLTSRHARAICIVALVLFLGTLPLIGRISFSFNPLKLKDQNTESISTFNELLRQKTNSPWTIIVLSSNARTAKADAERLGRVKEVDRTLMLADFIPDQQDEKLARLNEISLLMGPSLDETPSPSPPPAYPKMAAIRNLLEKWGDLLKADGKTFNADSAQRFRETLAAFYADMGAQSPEGQEQAMKRLEASLLGSLPARLHSLQVSLNAGPVTLHDLPGSLVERWVSKDGRYRIEVFPREDLNEEASMRRFVDAVRAVVPEITGFPVIMVDAGRAVVRSFVEASLWSLAGLIVLLVLLLPRRSDALWVMLPLALAWVLTAALMALLHLSFNFTNVIDLPLLLGYGANSGLYMVYRMRYKERGDEQLLQTSTTRAVIFCALTTFASFANLSISQHPGLASMGLLLTVGLALILLSDLILLPALLQPRKKR